MSESLGHRGVAARKVGDTAEPLSWGSQLDSEQERTARGRRRRVIRRQWCLRTWRRWEIPGGRAAWWKGQGFGHSSWSATIAKTWMAVKGSKWCEFRNKDQREPVQRPCQRVSWPSLGPPASHHVTAVGSSINLHASALTALHSRALLLRHSCDHGLLLDVLHCCWVKSRAGFTPTLPAFLLPPLVSQYLAPPQTCTLSLHTCCSPAWNVFLALRHSRNPFLLLKVKPTFRLCLNSTFQLGELGKYLTLRTSIQVWNRNIHVYLPGLH